MPWTRSSMAFFNNQGQIKCPLTRPEFEIVWVLMPVLITCKFDKGLINNDRTSLETSLSHFVHEKFSLLKGMQHWCECTSPAGIWTHMRFYVCIWYLQVWPRSYQKWPRKGGDTIFPIISQWEILVAMTTTVWSNLPKNLIQPFPHPNDATHKIWPRLAN